MFELAIAVFLILLNGLFALSELAVVSARKSRLKTMSEEGRPGATAAYALAQEPGRFLSTVQIGITLIGILAGAFSGAALGQRLQDYFHDGGMPVWLAEPLGFGIVISCITYLSVVIGELVPKHLALGNPERIACMVAPFMRVLARLGAPAVWLLDASTKLVFRLLGGSSVESSVTEDELKALVSEAEAAGVIETHEKRMISGILRLGDRNVRGLMTPRKDVDWLDVAGNPDDLRRQLLDTRHSLLPAAEGDTENILGVVQSRELLAALLVGRALDPRIFIKSAPVVPDSLDALSVLERLREADVPMIIVHDEYGTFEGVVTPADVLQAITGSFQSDLDEDNEEPVRREDGSWLLPGLTPVDELTELLGLPLPHDRNYHTVAGLVISQLGHLPKVGDRTTAGAWQLEVVDMDGRRIDKLLATRLTP